MEIEVEMELSNGTSDESGSMEESDDFFAFLYPYFLNRDPTSFGAWYVFSSIFFSWLNRKKTYFLFLKLPVFLNNLSQIWCNWNEKRNFHLKLRQILRFLRLLVILFVLFRSIEVLNGFDESL